MSRDLSNKAFSRRYSRKEKVTGFMSNIRRGIKISNHIHLCGTPP